MTFGFGNLLAGGGVAGTIAVIGYLIREFLKGRQEKRANAVEAESTASQDQATANATLLNTLSYKDREIDRLSKEVESLRAEVEAERKARQEERRTYQEELGTLREQNAVLARRVVGVDQRIAELQARLEAQDREQQ